MVSLSPDRALGWVAVLAAVLSAVPAGRAQATGAGGVSVGPAGYARPSAAANPARKTGTVTIPVHVSLVGGGEFTGLGALTEKRLLDNRLSLSIGETPSFDGGMIGNRANPFAASEARRAVDLEGTVWESGGTSLSLGGTLLQSTVTTVDEATALPSGEARYGVFGSGARLGLLGGRLRGSAEFAWSLNDRRTADGDPAAPLTADGAHRLGIGADLLAQENREASAYAYHRRIAPGYRTTMSEVSADRDELGAGGNIRIGRVAVEFELSSFRDNLDRAPAVLTMRNETAWAGLTLELAGPGRKSVLPSAIELTGHAAGRRGLPALSAGPIESGALIAERTAGQGLALHWGAPDDRVTLSWATGGHSARHADGNTAVSRHRTVALTRDLETPGWGASLSAYLGSARGAEWGDRFSTRKAGASVWVGTEGPAARRFDLFAGLDHRRIWNPDRSDLKVKTTWEIRTGVELLRLAPDGAAPTQPALSVYVAARGNAPDAAETGVRRIDLTAGVVGKLSF